MVVLDQAKRCAAGLSESDISARLSKPAPVKMRRLDEVDVALICQLYQDGQTVYEVAAEIGISRGRVSTVLKKAGIYLRRNSPTPEQIAEMARLYNQGLSLVRVGEQLGFNDGTVWNHLRAAGVAMRDTQGREVTPRDRGHDAPEPHAEPSPSPSQ